VGQLQDEPTFPDAARADDAYEPAPFVDDEFSQLRDVPIAADKARDGVWKSVARRLRLGLSFLAACARALGSRLEFTRTLTAFTLMRALSAKYSWEKPATWR
jgi:hypothetical protein